jgi:6-phosphogluconate dehydrogenase
MQLGMVGLGRMGSALVRRLLGDGHECVVTDVNTVFVEDLAAHGATPAADLDQLVKLLEPPRAVWIMVPAGVAGRVVADVASRLDEGDTVIDGGNTFYREATVRAPELARRGITHLDIGTSGGVHGLQRGFCLMIGGDEEAVQRLAPIFDSLAPGIDSADRTPGRTGPPQPAEQGWLRCGPPGAGHFVKMIHNGIEYGMMASLAEGLAILHAADLGLDDHATDAETSPLRDPLAYRYQFDLPSIVEVWRRGSVVGSWLVDLTAKALVASPELADLQGRVSDSGEGRWTVEAAVELGVPAPVITASLYQRFATRNRFEVGARVLSAMRREFGGHLELSPEEPLPTGDELTVQEPELNLPAPQTEDQQS